MLRRSQTIVLKDEPATKEEAPAPRTAADRRGLGPMREGAPKAELESQPPSQPQPEPAPAAAEDPSVRWREELAQQPHMTPEHRRNIERWRAEVLQSVSASEEGEALPSRWRQLLSPRNMALLAVALVAGGGAAFFAMQPTTPATPGAPQMVVASAAPAPEVVTQVVEEPTVPVLVAKSAIAVGQRFTPESVEWLDWPEDAVRAEFVTQVAAPEAASEMSGAVARYEFFPGEPIREAKLARADQGLLSAVLDPGTRAVSVAVSAESASGGFILPNDRVDIVLTASIANKQSSTTILRNVRVLAINSTIGETAATKPKPKNSGESDKPKEGEEAEEEAGPTTFASAIATLALDPQQAEVIITATLSGRLSMVLRPTADVAEVEPDSRSRAANEAIRISSPFWSN